MVLATCTDVFGDLSYPAMLDRVKSYGIDYVEMTAGGWSPCPHVKTAELLKDADKLKAFKAELEKRDMKIAALNCSGNPLIDTEMGKNHAATARQTIELAGKLGVEKIVMMSGLPGGAPGDRTPNWITTTVSWPDYMVETVRYQWEDVAIPWWKEFVKYADDHGVKQIALEEFPLQLVYNTDTLMRLRDAVGPKIGMNLDPSHLLAMGADPIAAARATGDAIYHIHGKDARIERGLCDVNGLMETRPVTDTVHRTWNYVAV